MDNAVKSQYLVSFLVTQRGDQIGWIEQVLLSGLRQGETLDTITITKLEQQTDLFAEYEKELDNEILNNTD